MFAKERPRLLGRSVMYFALRWDASSVNVRDDEFVELWFDTHNRVREISLHMKQNQ